MLLHAACAVPSAGRSGHGDLQWQEAVLDQVAGVRVRPQVGAGDRGGSMVGLEPFRGRQRPVGVEEEGCGAQRGAGGEVPKAAEEDEDGAALMRSGLICMSQSGGLEPAVDVTGQLLRVHSQGQAAEVELNVALPHEGGHRNIADADEGASSFLRGPVRLVMVVAVHQARQHRQVPRHVQRHLECF